MQNGHRLLGQPRTSVPTSLISFKPCTPPYFLIYAFVFQANMGCVPTGLMKVCAIFAYTATVGEVFRPPEGASIWVAFELCTLNRSFAVPILLKKIFSPPLRHRVRHFKKTLSTQPKITLQEGKIFYFGSFCTKNSTKNRLFWILPFLEIQGIIITLSAAPTPQHHAQRSHRPCGVSSL